MALTALEIKTAPPIQIPRIALALAIAASTGTVGLAITQSDDTFKVARFLEIGADVDIWWADTDAADVTKMRKIPAGSTHRLQTMPGSTQTYYIYCTSNANVVVSVEA